MQIDQPSIEELLRLIAAGHLDPHHAARKVLGLTDVPSSRTQLQTLDSLVRQFGLPPPEIETDWRRQIETLAHRWQQTHDYSLPELRPSDLLIDAENRLSIRPGLPAAGQTQIPGAITPEPQHNAASPLSQSQPAADLPFISESSSPAGRTHHYSEPFSANSSPRRRLVAAALIAVSAAAATYLLYTHFSTFSSGTQRTTAIRGDGVSPAAQPPHARSTGASAGAAPPGTHSRTPRPPVPPPASQDPSGRDDLGRDDLGWKNPLLSNLSAAVSEQTSAAAVAAAARDESSLLWDDVEAGDDGADTDVEHDQAGSPQDRVTLSAAPSEAITLPPLPTGAEGSQSELVFAAAVRDVHWDFPVPTTLSLRPLAVDAWALVDTTDDTELARLRATVDGLGFQWAADAASKPSARQIAAGRLRLTGLPPATIQNTLWLRPRLRSEPLAIDLTHPQTNASWPLEGPPLFSSAELAVEVVSPDSVQMSWIEPVDPHNLRRSRSLLQWTPARDSIPAIRCRIELRVTTRLSLKMRYAVQLDASMPWQPFSARQLAFALDQVTHTLNRSLADQTELARQSSAASTIGKRLIKPSKDALDQNVLRLQALMQRLQQLDALQTAVATGSEMRLGLTTHWPDGPQTILEMIRQE